ncbi:hypothetical protein AcW1_006797 [Taiwanofungus camphoratus]|nr:hypothetical protein AcW1_006797 [Antrodia cinnamomea]
MSRLSLAQQLAELSKPAPIDLDPEDVQAGVYSEDPSAIDNSAAREHYVDVAPSVIRKLHERVSDPKYDGVRTTRKQLLKDEEIESDHEEGSFDEFPPSRDEDEDPSDSEENDTSDTNDEEEARPTRAKLPSDEADSTQSKVLPSRCGDEGESQWNGNLASTLRKTREDDRQKGKAVSRQITLWDTLLDARIQLQKVANAANRLPVNTQLQSYASHQSVLDSLESMLGEAAALSEELFILQESLLEHNESVSAPPRKHRRVDDETAPHDYSEHLRDLSSSASTLEASWHAHLVHTLAKWSAKVQAVAPSVLLGNRNSFNKDDKGKIGVVSMVDEMLRTEGGKLLSRTRTQRSKGARLGSGDNFNKPAVDDVDAEDREDPEVFDDLDFYQQLLRDVIKARGGNDSQAGDQDWVAQQREKKAKRKLKVDTKASKGRKLRYEVHPKLQNFMVPVPVAQGAWHDEQIDGLFSSLLGTA